MIKYCLYNDARNPRPNPRTCTVAYNTCPPNWCKDFYAYWKAVQQSGRCTCIALHLSKNHEGECLRTKPVHQPLMKESTSKSRFMSKTASWNLTKLVYFPSCDLKSLSVKIEYITVLYSSLTSSLSTVLLSCVLCFRASSFPVFPPSTLVLTFPFHYRLCRERYTSFSNSKTFYPFSNCFSVDIDPTGSPVAVGL